MLPGRTKAEGDAIRAEQAKEAERTEILADLDALDRKSNRALRAIAAGTATDADRARIVEIEAEVVALRARLAELEG